MEAAEGRSGFIGQQAQARRRRSCALFADEMRRFLESEAVRREFWKALAENAIEIQAEIRLKPDEDGEPKPEVTAR